MLSFAFPQAESRLALLADVGQRARGCDRFGIKPDLDDRRLAAGACPLEGGSEGIGTLHRLAMAAEGARIGGEVRVLQAGSGNAARIFALLMHADGAVDAVV